MTIQMNVELEANKNCFDERLRGLDVWKEKVNWLNGD